LNKTSSCSGEYAIPRTSAENTSPVAMAQPVNGKKVILRDITLAALTKSKGVSPDLKRVTGETHH